jgi:beta-N-acetylhexosaminidase
MQLEEKIGQMLMVGFAGLEAPDYILDWLREGRVGGIVLFARNVDNPAQLAQLVQRLHDAAKYALLIGIDQEGGIVARLRQGFCESPGAMALSAAGADGPALTERVDRVLASELRALGINWDFAPAVDIAYNPENPSVGTRSFGADMTRVAALGAAAVRGFQHAGVAACAKHFPGLGSTAIDTHLALPTLDTPTDQLLRQDMLPFRAAIDAGVASIMTTHTIFSALDSQLPATLSPVIIQRLLREELKFDGVVSSDCMEMKALTDNFAPAETAILGALAGLDVIIFSHTRTTQEAVYEGLLAAARAGRVPLSMIDSANRRIAAMKHKYPAQPADVSAIRQPEHINLMLDAARAGTVLLRDDGLPALDEGTALIEFASYLDSGILESGGLSGFGTRLRERCPELPMVALDSNGYSADSILQAETLAQSARTLILATRSAHLNPDQLILARRLISLAKRVVHICLRNPYDAAALPGPDTVICTCGDSTPSLQAAVEALIGDFKPTGKLPVSVK